MESGEHADPSTFKAEPEGRRSSGSRGVRVTSPVTGRGPSGCWDFFLTNGPQAFICFPSCFDIICL